MCEEKNVKDYLMQIRKIPLLNFEEELSLAEKIQSGDEFAKNKLVESNLRLVVAVARRYVSNDVSILDLIQEGNIGLITAAEKYLSSYNVRFSTYACWWIQQSITRSISNKKRIIRLPYRKEEMVRKLKKANSELYQVLGREPSDEYLADYIGCTVDEVKETKQYSQKIASLDYILDDEEKFSLKEIISDMTFNPETTFMKNYTKTYVFELLNDLKENERDIVIKRYNLSNGSQSLTLKKISSEYGVSAETIRQIEKKAISKLRRKSEEIKQVAYC